MPLTRIRTDDLLSGSVANGTLNATALTGQASSTAADNNDLILIYDNTASALRKQTRADFFTAGIPTLTGSNTFTGTNKFSTGLSGSLTRLTDGTSYLAGGTNVTITSASNGQVVIGTSGGNTLDAAYDQGGAGLGRFITASNGAVDIQASSDSNSPTELLTLAISGSVSGTDAGPRIMFKIPYSDEAYTGAAIDAIKSQTSSNNSTTELRFYASGDNQTLDDKMIVNTSGVGIAGGAGTTIPNLGSGNHALYVATTGDANALTIKAANGRIGIGTNGPEAHVHIKDTDINPAVGFGYADQYHLAIEGNTTSGRYMGMCIGSSEQVGAAILHQDLGSYSQGDLTFWAKLSTSENGAPVERMRINRHGNIGLSESDPQYMIHAASTGSVGFFLEADTDNSGELDNPFIKLSQDNTAVQSIIGLCGATDKDPENVTYTGVVNNNMLIGTTTNFGLQLGTNDNVRMTIENAGYVGIGDTTPTYPLSVASSNSAGYVSQIYNSYNGNAGGLWVKAGDTSTSVSPLPFVVQSYNGTNQFYVRQDGAYYHRGSSISTGDSKRDVVEMSESATDLLKDIRVVSYNYKEDPDDRARRIGFIADDATNQPSIDSRLTNGGTGFDIQTLVGTLIKAVQELESRIDNLESGD